MQRALGWSLFLMIAVALLSSCSTTRFVPEGQYLLSDVSLKVDKSERKEVNLSQMKAYVRQNPNSRLFGLIKLPLRTYSLSGRDSSKWINRTLRSFGEAPVIFDSLQTLRSCADLQQELRNRGYMRARVTYDVKRRGKKASVSYHLQPGTPFYVSSLNYVIADSCIANLLTASGDSLRRLLSVGMKFDVSLLDAERKRITTFLTDNGYYRFHKEFITYRADSVRGSQLVDLTLLLRPYQRNNMPDTLHTKYTIRSISYQNGDADDDRMHLRRRVLEECTYLNEGQPYSGTKLQNTYNHFGRLQAVKYTNIAMRQVPDTSLLDCNVTLLTNKPSTISFQPEGTNTAGDLGAAVSVTYQNRNLFRGSEVLSIEFRGAYEAIKGLEGYAANEDFVEYSTEAKLTFPRFIIPFFSKKYRRSMDATSEVSLLYDIQSRPEFQRQVVSGALRFRWSFPQHRSRYQLDLLDLDYVFMPWISTTFKKEYLESENTRNAVLRYNYEDLFITKIGFSYSYNNQSYALKTNVETSGNVLSLLAHTAGLAKDNLDQYKVFNIAFAQYAKGDFDLTRSFQIDRNNQLVFHLGVGIAYPYGNSTVLPFEKRYFSGGANSVRGWSVRSLGPGSFKEKDGRINFISQTGDMKLDLNAEYRTHLFWKLGGALFVDAGNIWTLRENGQEGGLFRFNEFYKQLAASYGVGLRFNFDYFILRFDLGMKAVNPSFRTDDSEHYPIIHPRFSRDYAFHFAVGLPF
ncbi:MAG: BamA/TamA family outer membrane protein [Prevotella sp.]|nr:BamA/TamA family outer membrane protein [Prevotella sp.]